MTKQNNKIILTATSNILIEICNSNIFTLFVLCNKTDKLRVCGQNLFGYASGKILFLEAWIDVCIGDTQNSHASDSPVIDKVSAFFLRCLFVPNFHEKQDYFYVVGDCAEQSSLGHMSFS